MFKETWPRQKHCPLSVILWEEYYDVEGNVVSPNALVITYIVILWEEYCDAEWNVVSPNALVITFIVILWEEYCDAEGNAASSEALAVILWMDYSDVEGNVASPKALVITFIVILWEEYCDAEGNMASPEALAVILWMDYCDVEGNAASPKALAIAFRASKIRVLPNKMQERRRTWKMLPIFSFFFSKQISSVGLGMIQFLCWRHASDHQMKQLKNQCDEKETKVYVCTTKMLLMKKSRSLHWKHNRSIFQIFIVKQNKFKFEIFCLL